MTSTAGGVSYESHGIVEANSLVPDTAVADMLPVGASIPSHAYSAHWWLSDAGGKRVTVDTSASDASRVGVFVSDAMAAGIIAQDDRPSGGLGTVTFIALPGRTYYIELYTGSLSEATTYRMTVTTEDLPVTSQSGSSSPTTATEIVPGVALTGVTYPCLMEQGEEMPYWSAWWKFRSGRSATITVDTSPSWSSGSRDTYVKIFKGQSGPTELVAEDDESGESSAALVIFSASAFETYYIQVGSYFYVNVVPDYYALAIDWGDATPAIDARWSLRDPATNEIWVFPHNPKKMTSPHPPKQTQIFSRGIGGISRVLQYRQAPYEWQFSGVIRTEEHFSGLTDWTKKTGIVHLTDHLGRTWRIRMQALELDEKRPSRRSDWRFEYTVRATIYGAVL